MNWRNQEIALRAHFVSPSPVAAPAANRAGIQIFLLYGNEQFPVKQKRRPTREPCAQKHIAPNRRQTILQYQYYL